MADIMCGIAGIWSHQSGETHIRVQAIRNMTNAIRHRGPDSSGEWLELDAGIALGHRRLAVVDISPAGAQPMASSSGRYILTFNGEIYNHSELRQKVSSTNFQHVWRGHSDTESLLASIEQFGLNNTLEQARGMFAFALWDRQTQSLHLARDRFGEKPLYFGWLGRKFVFASELHAITAQFASELTLNMRGLNDFLQFGYIPTPQSAYQQIAKLPAGTTLTLHTPDGRATPTPYWSVSTELSNAQSQGIVSSTSLIEIVEGYLSDSVKSQMISDVPLGSFLSGGIDSTIITALMQRHSPTPIKTFSIGFTDPRYDESRTAKLVAGHLGTDHYEYIASSSDLLEIAPKLPKLYDEPFADSSQIPTILLSRFAKQHVTVALTGDGGDEIFAGYNRYIFADKAWRAASKIPAFIRARLPTLAQLLIKLRSSSISSIAVTRMGLPGSTLDKLAKLADAVGNAHSINDLYLALISTHFPNGHRSPHLPQLAQDFSNNVTSTTISNTELMIAYDLLTYLPDDILTKVDRASMSTSLETRAPFLDHRLFALSLKMPMSHKIADGRGKIVLREILKKYVPNALVERPKQGFAIPINDWLRSGLKDWAGDLLTSQNLIQKAGLDIRDTTAMWEQHMAEQFNHGEAIWAILCLLTWIDSQSNQSGVIMSSDQRQSQ